jgi:hypothetical protein
MSNPTPLSRTKYVLCASSDQLPISTTARGRVRVYLMAFASRFSSTSRSMTGSACAGARSPMRQSMLRWPMSWARPRSTSATSMPMSTVSGIRRLRLICEKDRRSSIRRPADIADSMMVATKRLPRSLSLGPSCSLSSSA